MNEGLFHSLLDFAQREPLELVSVLVAVPALFLFLFVATFRRIHPAVVWLVLSAAFFGFSQIFAENRNQRLSIGVTTCAVCAALTWWWFRHVAPDLRARLGRGRDAR